MRSLAKRFATAGQWLLLFALPIAVLSVVGAHAAFAEHAKHLTPALGFAVLAIGKESDFIIYQAQFQTGLVEKVAQFLQIFNEGTRGAIQLIPNALKGDYSQKAFFKDIATLVTRRDTTSTSAATITPMTQDEVISVKINRKIGPVSQTLDAFKKAGLSDEDASLKFGEYAAARKMKDMVNTALIAAETAIQAVTAANYDVTGLTGKTGTTAYLQTALSKFGDAAQDIVCWVSHSKVYNDIVAALLASNTLGVTDILTIQGAIPAWLGRPQIVTDSPALTDANGSATDTYNTLGLVEGAVIVEESEDETFFTQILGGAENLYRIFQSEYAYNITVKGMKWNISGGGANPLDTALATTSNWVKVAADTKLTAGVRLVSQ